MVTEGDKTESDILRGDLGSLGHFIADAVYRSLCGINVRRLASCRILHENNIAACDDEITEDRVELDTHSFASLVSGSAPSSFDGSVVPMGPSDPS